MYYMVELITSIIQLDKNNSILYIKITKSKYPV